MKKTITTLFAFVLVAFVVLKISLIYLGQQQIRQIKAALASDAAIETGWIYSDLNGTLGTYGVSTTVFVPKYRFSAESISLKASSLFNLPFVLLDLQSGYFPGQLLIQASGVTLPVMTLKRDFESPQPQVLDVLLQRYQCLAQADTNKREQLGIVSLLNAIGIQEIRGDVSIHVQQLPDQIALNAAFTSSEIGEVGVEAYLSGSVKSLLRVNSSAESSPALQMLKISYSDKGLMRRISYYCGSHAEQSRQEYAKVAAKSWATAMFKGGFTIPDSLVQGYQNHLQNGGRLSIQLTNTKPVALSSVVEPSSLPDWWPDLNMKVKLDETILSDQPTVLDSARYLAYFSPPPTKDDETGDNSRKPDTPRLIEPSYQRIMIENVADNIGHLSRIQLLNGRILEGRLSASREFSIEVSQEVSGGTVSFPVDKRDIEWIETFKVVAPGGAL